MISVAADQRDPLEELAADYADRLRRGERPNVADYQRRNPNLAKEISEFFPTVAALEGLRDPGIPERVGEFRLLRELGRGGMGAVYEAEQPSLHRRVAVKILTGRDNRSRARFQREARLAARLSHPNILPVYASGDEGGTAWIAMQLVSGVGLDRVIEELSYNRVPPTGKSLAAIVTALRTNDKLPLGALRPSHYREIALRGAQAAEALHFAHGEGVLHRDVKPANLLFGEDGRLWVADFGLAKAGSDDDVTGSNMIAGTLRYTAPERFSGQCDARSDVYSLGVTLFEILALRPAFNTPSTQATMGAILNVGVPDLKKLAPGAPPQLIRVIARACARDPLDRPQDAAQFATELRSAAEGTAVTLPLPRAEMRRRQMGLWLGAGLAAGTMVAGAWWLLWPGKKLEPPMPAVATAIVPAAPPATTISTPTSPTEINSTPVLTAIPEPVAPRIVPPVRVTTTPPTLPQIPIPANPLPTNPLAREPIPVPFPTPNPETRPTLPGQQIRDYQVLPPPVFPTADPPARTVERPRRNPGDGRLPPRTEDGRPPPFPGPDGEPPRPPKPGEHPWPPPRPGGPGGPPPRP